MITFSFIFLHLNMRLFRKFPLIFRIKSCFTAKLCSTLLNHKVWVACGILSWWDVEFSEFIASVRFMKGFKSIFF